MPYLSDQYVIPEDQYDNGNIKGTLQSHQWLAHTKAQSDARLKTIFTDFWAPDGRFNYDKPEFEALAAEFSPGNLTMLMLLIAEEAYMRDILDEEDFLDLQDEG